MQEWQENYATGKKSSGTGGIQKVIENDKCSTSDGEVSVKKGYMSEKKYENRQKIANKRNLILTRKTIGTAKFGDWQENMVSGRKIRVHPNMDLTKFP